jgi:hypothetical protein
MATALLDDNLAAGFSYPPPVRARAQCRPPPPPLPSLPAFSRVNVWIKFEGWSFYCCTYIG